MTVYYLKRKKKNKKIILAGARSETTTDNFISAAQANVSKGAIPNVSVYRFFTPWMVGLHSSPHHLLSPKNTHQKKKDPSEETGERGVARATASLKGAQTRKVGGGRGTACTRGGGHFATTDGLPEGRAFQSRGTRGKEAEEAKMTTPGTERSLGLCSSAVAFSSCLSLSLVSLGTPSSSPLPPADSSFPFFSLSWKKRKKEN